MKRVQAHAMHYGMEWPDYFTGGGDFVGCGCTPYEALQDAREQAAMDGVQLVIPNYRDFGKDAHPYNEAIDMYKRNNPEDKDLNGFQAMYFVIVDLI